jgi:hypothetical protein
MSAARRGKKLSPEHIENAAAGKRGKPLSQSHKAKLSQIMTSVETRSKISAAVRASWKRRKESVAEAYA